MRHFTLFSAIALVLLAYATGGSAAADYCGPAVDMPAKERLAAFLRKPDNDKSEFETSAQYQARLVAAVGTDTIRLVTPVNPILASHDADAQAFVLRYSDIALNFVMPQFGWWGVELEKTTDRARTYVGQNAYGARARVVSTNTTLRAVSFKGGYGGYRKTVSIPMPPAAAKAAKSKLKILIVGRLIPPFVRTDYNSTTATVQTPSEIALRYTSLTIEPTCGAILNSETGEVLANFNPSEIGL